MLHHHFQVLTLYIYISLSSLEIALELRFTSMTDFHTLSTTLKLMKYYLDIITRYKIGFNRLFMLYQVQILFFTSRTRFAFKFLHQSLAFPIYQDDIYLTCLFSRMLSVIKSSILDIQSKASSGSIVNPKKKKKISEEYQRILGKSLQFCNLSFHSSFFFFFKKSKFCLTLFIIIFSTIVSFISSLSFNS